ncbi:MAG: phosphate ABC transporter permease subunit PstC [Peptoniphilaceae bacterium]|nr:phosphate ABC transporter permease subunit PstC [Peptoniphilaceae bacterium]MDD7383422.1 phosphate ABC transporter permease subunit PstC [Peptoniphilaceae bacterium]MDY3738817.1 phosphate ABC transporter permease subunit PstC [Peptoniphilaceae bacterium]
MKNTKDKIFNVIFLISAILSISLIFIICFFIFKTGISFVNKYGLIKFITGTDWSPSNSPQSFGILPMIVGSIIVTVLSILFSFPFGICLAVYIAYYAGKKEKILTDIVNLMAGIPSVVYGFFAMMVIVPIISKIPSADSGMNILSASILLSIMILPTIVDISSSSLKALPQYFYTASLALGATKEETIFKIMLPAAKAGIFSAVILGLGRSIGETMAVYLVIGNQARMPSSILDGVRTMTTNIVLEMGYATGIHREALIATGMVLFVFILIINILFNIIRNKSEEKMK